MLRYALCVEFAHRDFQTSFLVESETDAVERATRLVRLFPRDKILGIKLYFQKEEYKDAI